MGVMKKNFVILALVVVMLAELLYPAVPAAAAGVVTISHNSETIQVGETCQLSAFVDGVQADAAWGSSDAGVAAVDENGKVTGIAAGSAVITAMVNGTSVECIISVIRKSNSGTVRYNVLILDLSSSMDGIPLAREKEAAKKFCDKVLASQGDNYLAIVELRGNAKILSTFTNNADALKKAINGLKSVGNTNMNEALQKAGELLASAPGGKDVMKNIILCSDGLPKKGTTLANGRYTAADYGSYQYANAVYRTASALKNKNYFIYALGFFHKLTGKKLKFGKVLMKDIASRDKYYIITDPDDVNDVFDDIADKITSVTVSPKSVSLKVGQTCSLKAYKNGVSKKASWTSKDKSIASVDSSGKVTARKAGKTTITAIINGKKAVCTVTVNKKKVSKPKQKPKTTIRLNKSSTSVYVGKNIRLKAIVKGTNKKVKWKSSDRKTATVKNGKVTGIKEGRAVITATVNGKSAACRVTVKIKHPDYSQYFMVPATRSDYGSHKIDEYGVRLVVNSGAKVKKCAIYLKKNGSTYERTLACKGKNITSATYVPYLAYKGKTYYDGLRTHGINTFSLSSDSKGVWSRNGNYTSTTANLTDSNNRELTIRSTGVAGRNMRVFYDLEKMKKWLNK